jgi:DNA-binding transcriptional ArsR family regulator
MDVFTAIADPTRRRMIELLATADRPAGEFALTFPMVRQPTLSHHLKVLREAGLVAVRADAQKRIYSLRRDPLAELRDWLSRSALYWNDELDALEQHLDDRQPDDGA